MIPDNKETLEDRDQLALLDPQEIEVLQDQLVLRGQQALPARLVNPAELDCQEQLVQPVHPDLKGPLEPVAQQVTKVQLELQEIQAAKVHKVQQDLLVLRVQQDLLVLLVPQDPLVTRGALASLDLLVHKDNLDLQDFQVIEELKVQLVQMVILDRLVLKDLQVFVELPVELDNLVLLDLPVLKDKLVLQVIKVLQVSQVLRGHWVNQETMV